MRRAALAGLVVLLAIVLVLMVGAARRDQSVLGSTIEGTRCPTSTHNLLVAQSVQSASYIPCLTELSTEWSSSAQDVSSSGTTESWSLTEASGVTWTVVLGPSCDPGSAAPPTEPVQAVGSDATPTIRVLEAISDDGAVFERVQYFVFDGGCVTSTIRVPTKYDRQLVVATADDSLALVPRTTLNRERYDASGGRFGLDPTP